MALDGHGPTSLAEAVGLTYVGDHDPGLNRIPSPIGFDYFDASGAHVADPDKL